MPARLIPQTEGSRTIPLDKAITLIGRHPDCDAVLDDNQKISRRHCCIAQVENRLVVRDLGSMNGIRVNGETVVEADLREGDEITIGDEEFVLDLSSAPDPARPVSATAAPASKSKRGPKPLPGAVPLAPVRPINVPADISQEFPVAIPEEDEDLRLNFPTPAAPPMSKSALKKLIIEFDDQPPPEQILELDSGELKLDDLDNLGKK